MFQKVPKYLCWIESFGMKKLVWWHYLPIVTKDTQANHHSLTCILLLKKLCSAKWILSGAHQLVFWTRQVNCNRSFKRGKGWMGGRDWVRTRNSQSHTQLSFFHLAYSLSLSLSLSFFLLSPPNDNPKNRNVLPHARALLARTNKEQKAPGVGMYIIIPPLACIVIIIIITPPPPPYDYFKPSLFSPLSYLFLLIVSP